MTNRWEPFSDDEVAELYVGMGEARPNDLTFALYDELKAELTRRRPDDPLLLTALGGPIRDSRNP